MARKNWGDARAEVLALMPEINKLVSAGIKHVKIYELMQVGAPRRVQPSLRRSSIESLLRGFDETSAVDRCVTSLRLISRTLVRVKRSRTTTSMNAVAKSGVA